MPCKGTTLEQDMHVLSLMDKAGLARINIDSISDPADVGRTILVTAFNKGVLFDLLAATMQEEGKTWSPEGAKEISVAFSQASAQDEKQAIQDSLVGVLLGFFITGGLSSLTSRTSSSPPSLEREGQSEPAERNSEELGTTETGTQ